tara:strand:+ start:127 stop:1251 length:1125 start_codon:yes stop_codon:yes gene_type:complete
MDLFITAKRSVSVRSHLGALLTPPTRRKYVSWGYPDGSVRFHVAIATPRHLNVGKVISVHENLHTGTIRCAVATDDGSKLITGGDDCTVGVWSFIKNGHRRMLTLLGHLCGHDDAVLSVTVCQEHGIIVSGSKDGSAIVWDLQTLTFVRELSGHNSAISIVSCNKCTGDIMTITEGDYSSEDDTNSNTNRNNSDHNENEKHDRHQPHLIQELRIWSINGYLLVHLNIDLYYSPKITSSIMLGKEWWQDGIAVVTGHANGLLQLWELEFPSDPFVIMGNGKVRRKKKKKKNGTTTKKQKVQIKIDGVNTKVTPPWTLSVLADLNVHQSAITKICVVGNGHECILGTGDASGLCLRWQQDRKALFKIHDDVSQLFS